MPPWGKPIRQRTVSTRSVSARISSSSKTSLVITIRRLCGEGGVTLPASAAAIGACAAADGATNITPSINNVILLTILTLGLLDLFYYRLEVPRTSVSCPSREFSSDHSGTFGLHYAYQVAPKKGREMADFPRFGPVARALPESPAPAGRGCLGALSLKLRANVPITARTAGFSAAAPPLGILGRSLGK